VKLRLRTAANNGPIVHPQMIWVWAAMVEWYWQGKTEELEQKAAPLSFFYNKSHMDWTGREPGPPWWEGD
jgi:hypothetical protein